MSNFSLRIASSNQYFFSNAQMYDACFLTQSNAQRLLFGVQQNAPANITISSNLAAFSGNVAFNNAVSFAGITINPRNGGPANLTATSILGYSNTSNGVLLTMDSNTSNYSYSFNAATSNLMTIQGNGYIGINKSNPAYPLDVIGDLNFSGILRKGGVPYVGSQWSNNLSNVFLMSSNVGIGKMYPAYPLDIAGDLNFDGILRKNGVPYVSSQWSNNSSNVFLMTSNVGIGKMYPTYPLDVTGDINLTGTLRKNGVPYVGSQWSNNLSNVFLMTSNVGIGKMYPTYPLDIAGDLNFDGILRKGGVPYVGSQWSNNSNNVFLIGSNVGINKIAPAYPLDIAGDLNFDGILRKGGVPYVGSQWSNNSNNVFLMSCNIGIGTSNPQALLHVASNLRVDGSVQLYNAVQFTGIELIPGLVQNNYTSVIASTSNIQGYSNLSNGTLFSIMSNTSNDVFKYVSGSSSNELMRLTGAGNLGIGTSNPQATLDIVGSLNVSSNITAPGSSSRIWDYSGTMIVNGQPGPISSSTITGSNITVSTTMSPFSGINNEGSIYFPGVAGNYLTVAPAGSLAAPTGALPDFTIECWVNLPVYPAPANTGNYSSIPYLIGQMASSSTLAYMSFGVGGPSQNKVTFWTGSTGCGISGSSVIPLNTWTHIAVTYTTSSKTIQLFINGAPDTLTTWLGTVSSGSSTTTITFTGAASIDTAQPLFVGQYNSVAMNCYISNLRYTQQVLYTGSFTPSTTPLQVIDTTTKLLLRAPLQNGIISTNPIKCISGIRAHSLPSDALIYADCYGTNLPNLSGANAPTFDTTQAMCIRFDRSKSQYLSFPAQTFNMATQGFTAICKFAFTGTTVINYENLFNFNNGGANNNNSSINLMRGGTTAYIFGSIWSQDQSSSFYTPQGSIINQNVVYTAIVRFDPFTNNNNSTLFGTLTIWINGKIISSVIGTSAIAIIDRTLQYITIGVTANVDIYNFAAYNRALTDKEITEASSMLMATTTGLPNESTLEIGTASGKPALRIKNDGTLSIAGPIVCTNNTSYAPVDMGINKYPISGYIVGSVPATGTSPFGVSEGSLLLSSYNYLTITPKVGFSWWTLGFTMELWVNYSSFATNNLYNGSQSSLISDNAGPYFSFGPLANGTVTFFYYTSGNNNITTTTTIPLNTWTHLAVSYDLTTIRVYIGGVLSASGAISGTPNSGFIGAPMNIGYTTYTPTASITNFRIVNGAALYTSTFTPSTSPLGPAPTGTTALLLRVPQDSGKLLVKQIGGTSTVQAYPPAAMTGNMTNIQNTSYGAGTYIVSASSVNPPWPSWQGFSTSSIFWNSLARYTSLTGTYNGSSSTNDIYGQSYSGEWIQIQLPTNIVISSYSITPQSGPINTPYTFYLLGSTDGSSWKCINSQIATTWTSNTQNFYVCTSTACTYYRIVVSSIKGVLNDVTISLGAITFYGTQSSINITPDGQVGIGVINPTQQLEVAGNAIINGNISAGNLGMFRNRIINGDMRIDQRNSGTNITTASTYQSIYCIDRWQVYTDVANTILFGQNADAPPGFSYSLNLATTTTSTANSVYLIQTIEGYNISDLGYGTVNSKPVTVSFWVKTNIIGSYSVALINVWTSRTKYNITPFTVTTSGAWQYITVTFIGDTTNTLPSTTNGTGLSLLFSVGMPSFASSTINTWTSGNSLSYSGNLVYGISNTSSSYIRFSGVQFEKGTIATPFEFRPYAIELQMCQRYLQMIGSTSYLTALGSGSVGNAGNMARIYVKYNSTMRTGPTPSCPNFSKLYACNGVGGDITVSGFASTTWYSTDSSLMDLSLSNAMVNGIALTVYMDHMYIILSAEL